MPIRSQGATYWPISTWLRCKSLNDVNQKQKRRSNLLLFTTTAVFIISWQFVAFTGSFTRFYLPLHYYNDGRPVMLWSIVKSVVGITVRHYWYSLKMSLTPVQTPPGLIVVSLFKVLKNFPMIRFCTSWENERNLYRECSLKATTCMGW